jgi:hypothetical protein
MENGLPREAFARSFRGGADVTRRDPSFDGDFTTLAERLGWTSGQLWRQNPAIRIAMKRWLELRNQEISFP